MTTIQSFALLLFLFSTIVDSLYKHSKELDFTPEDFETRKKALQVMEQAFDD